MTVDYGNQLANLIIEYLPYTSAENFGSKYQCTAFTASATKMTLTFSSGNYTTITAIINDALNPNRTFTIAGFYLKNTITTFAAYPAGATSYYAFQIEFSRPHKYVKDSLFTAKAFTNTSYNIQYKVLRVIDQYSVVAYPMTTVTIATLTTGLGQVPTLYTAGLNGIKYVTAEGSNQISFVIDPTEMFTTITNADIDTTYLPYLYHYTEFVKNIEAKTFVENLTDRGNSRYLIIDSTSLKGEPNRSKYNTSDAVYQAYGRGASYDKNYTMNLLYIIQRYANDGSNQADSSSDMMALQMEMHDALLSITRQPFDEEANKTLSSLTIQTDSVTDSISEGKKVITFEIGFSVFFNNDIILKKDDKNTYPINSLKFNTNEVIFS